jgi:VCBS repeat-containing protein
MQQEETLTVPAPGLLGNDTDPDGDPLTAAVEINPANGSVALNADGSFTYTPDTGFFGTDTFTYQIVDGQGGTDTAVVTLTVNETIPTETYFVYMPFVKK